MKTHLTYWVVILILGIVIMFMRTCTPKCPEIKPGKPIIITKTVEVPVKKEYKDPKPKTSKPLPPVITEKGDTCPPIELNTYELVVDDSVLSGTTTVEVEGKLKSVLLDYKAKQKTVETTIVDTVMMPAAECPKGPKGLYLGVNMGGNFKLNQAIFAPQVSLVSKHGYIVNLSHDIINKNTLVGYQLKIGKK